MKKEYEEYFDEAYQFSEVFPFPPFKLFDTDFRVIRKIVSENTGKERPLIWRSDARLFLAVNFYHMVVAPYSHVSRPRLYLDNELTKIIKIDVEEICYIAEATAQERGKNYVSGSSVLVAVGKIVDYLKVTEMQFWGVQEQPKNGA